MRPEAQHRGRSWEPRASSASWASQHRHPGSRGKCARRGSRSDSPGLSAHLNVAEDGAGPAAGSARGGAAALARARLGQEPHGGRQPRGPRGERRLQLRGAASLPARPGVDCRVRSGRPGKQGRRAGAAGPVGGVRGRGGLRQRAAQRLSQRVRAQKFYKWPRRQ